MGEKRENPRTTRAREQYLGKEYSFKNGDPNTKMKVVEFKDFSKVTVQVGDTDMYITAHMSNIKSGMLNNPFRENAPIGFTDPKYEYLNCIFKTNQGYFIRVLNCENRAHVLYEFIDNGYQDTTALHNILVGEIRNPFHKNKFGGYLGPDKTFRRKEFKWLHTIWTTLLIRGGDNRAYYLKYHDSRAYDDVMFDDSWYCFSIFAQWYMSNLSQLNPNFKYVIDKDLKYPFYSQFTGGRKCYGPGTCLLIPVELNHMIGSEFVREHHDNNIRGVLPADHPLKNAARYYKEQNALLDEAYNIIMNM